MQEYCLGRLQELRIRVGKTPIELRVINGSATIFGCLLKMNFSYIFRVDESFAITSLDQNGCKINICGEPHSIYIPSIEPQLLPYLNFEAFVYSMRTNFQEKNDKGPVILIVGPRECGKSSFCRLLCNYGSYETKREMVYMDLDPDLNDLTIPGCIAARIWKRAMALPFGCNQEDIFAQNDCGITMWFGYTNPLKAISLYKRLYKQLYLLVQARIAGLCHKTQNEARSSGIIINTISCNDMNTDTYNCITQQINDFNIDAIVVMGDEALHQKMTKDTTIPKNIPVYFQPKSSGVVPRLSRNDVRQQRIQDYFYGPKRPHEDDLGFEPFDCFRVEVKETDICVKFGDGSVPRDSTLPIGKKPHLDPDRAQIVHLSEYNFHVVAFVPNVLPKMVKDYGIDDQQKINMQPVIGFGYVSQTRPSCYLTIPGEHLPKGCAILVGSITYREN